MPKNAIDLSIDLEDLLGGGEGFFADGVYEVVRSRYAYFDFNKGPGNEALCLMQELKPVDGEGEAAPRYWPIGDSMKDGTKTVEPINPVKGEKGAWSGIRFTEANKYDKIYTKSDFATYLTHARKAEVDMDAIGNDITAFDGMVLEFGKYIVPDKERKQQTVVEAAEGGRDAKKYPKEVIVITGVPKKGKKATKAKKEVAAEEEDEAPAKKTKKAKGPAAIITAYLEENVVSEVKDDGSADWLSHRLALSKHLTKDLGLEPDEVKSIMAVYNDREDGLPEILKELGLMIDDEKAIVKAKKK